MYVCVCVDIVSFFADIYIYRKSLEMRSFSSMFSESWFGYGRFSGARNVTCAVGLLSGGWGPPGLQPPLHDAGRGDAPILFMIADFGRSGWSGRATRDKRHQTIIESQSQ